MAGNFTSGDVVPTIYGTPDDPRHDSALRPWQWLPVVFLLLCAVLFFSLRRAKALELYDRAKDYLFTKAPFLANPSQYVRLGPTDLSRSPLDRRRGPSSGNDDDDDGLYSDSDLDATSPSLGSRGRRTSPFDDEFADELPRSNYVSPRRRVSQAAESIASGVNSLMVALGWDGRARSAFEGGGGGKSDGIARAFWGTRHARRTGTIKLGDEHFGAVEEGRTAREDMNGGKGGFGSSSGGETGRGRSNSARTSISSSGALFEADADAEVADELPHDFSLNGGSRSSGAD